MVGLPRLIRAAPPATAMLLVVPVLIGTAGLALPFRWVEGGAAAALGQFLAAPGIWRSVLLSMGSALSATLLSLLLVLGFTAAAQGTRAGRRLFALMSRAISPLLAVPHAAMAVGLAFLLAPSGWAFRLASPWATGLVRPPDLLILQDPWGLALTLGLVVKETPFLFLMTLAALPQTDSARRVLLGRSLGYGPMAAWCAGVAPALLAQLRLPVLAVLAYGISAADMAIILGPTTPAPLPVRALHWLAEPDLAQRGTAAIAGLAMLAATIATAALLWLLARLAFLGWRGWMRRGWHLRADRWLRFLAIFAMGAVAALGMLGLAALLLWAMAGPWRFPDALPQSLDLTRMVQHLPGLWPPLRTTLLLAGLSTALAVVLVVACLENEGRRHRPGAGPGIGRGIWLLYLPLILPQMSFLYGLQAAAASIGPGHGLALVAWGHLLFVLPYVYLSLADPWRAWDRRYERVARGLGAGPARLLFGVKLPMLLAPVLIAAAVGIAVSTALYLPTVLLGAGRVVTLTTEAVALSGGQDRRLLALFAVMQMAVPFLAFLLAHRIPALVAPGGARHV